MGGLIFTYYISFLSLLSVVGFFWSVLLLREYRHYLDRHYLLFAFLGNVLMVVVGIINLAVWGVESQGGSAIGEAALSVLLHFTSFGFLFYFAALASAYSFSVRTLDYRKVVTGLALLVSMIPLALLVFYGYEAYVWATRIVLALTVLLVAVYALFLGVRKYPQTWSKDKWPELLVLLFGVLLIIDLAWIAVAQRGEVTTFSFVTVLHQFFATLYTPLFYLSMLLVSSRESGKPMGPVQVIGSHIQSKMYLVYIFLFMVMFSFPVYFGSSWYTNNLAANNLALLRLDASLAAAELGRGLSDLEGCAARVLLNGESGAQCGEGVDLIWPDGPSLAFTESDHDDFSFKGRLSYDESDRGSMAFLSNEVTRFGRPVLTVRQRTDLSRVMSSINGVATKSGVVTLFDTSFRTLASSGLRGDFEGFSESETLSSGQYAASISLEDIIVPVIGGDGEAVGYLALVGSDFSFQSAATSVLSWFIYGSFVVFIMVSLVVFLVTMYMVKPIISLTEAAGKISGGDYDFRVGQVGSDEIGQLADSFNRMADTVRDKISELKERDREQRDFMAYVSHELKSPISVIGWNIELLTDGSDQGGGLSDEQVGILSDISSVSGRMNRLVNDLGDASKIGRGKMAFALRPLELADSVSKFVERALPGASKKSVNVTFDYPDDRGEAWVQADAGRVDQILDNLIGNAVKYSGEQGEVRVSLNPTADGRFAVTVVDSGRGIPEADQDKIFQRFFRAGNASDQGTPGSGLGLYVSRELARLMGGDITFTSEEGRGSEFTFTLPKSREDERPSA